MRSPLRLLSIVVGVLGIALVFERASVAAMSIRTDTDATAHADGAESKDLKAQTAVEFPEDVPVVIEAHGRVPVLVVPLKGKSSDVQISLPKISDWHSDAFDEKLDKSLGEVMEGGSKVQKLLKERKTAEALSLLDDLNRHYPNLFYLGFLRASALVMTGNKQGAITALERALKTHPENEEGRGLLRALTQGRSEAKP